MPRPAVSHTTIHIRRNLPTLSLVKTDTVAKIRVLDGHCHECATLCGRYLDIKEERHKQVTSSLDEMLTMNLNLKLVTEENKR